MPCGVRIVRSAPDAVNALASPPPRRRGPPPNASTPDDAAAELDRLARNRGDPHHRPVMHEGHAPLPPHTETSPAFRAMQLAAAVERAEAEAVEAHDAVKAAKRTRTKKGKRTQAEAEAKARLAAANEALNTLRADLAVERAEGDAARLAFLERQERVERSEHDDPDDANERSAKPRKVRGHRTACRVRFLLRRDKHGGLLREAHVRAADTLRLHWDIARFGLSADPDAARTRRSGPRTGPTQDEHAQAAAARLFAEAIQRVGVISEGLLLRVVLDNWTIARWCDDRWERAGKPEGKRPNETAAMGLLIGALDRLAAHYEIA